MKWNPYLLLRHPNSLLRCLLTLKIRLENLVVNVREIESDDARGIKIHKL